MGLRNVSNQLASSQLARKTGLLWEWNGTDVSQFGDGDGSPNASNGTVTGSLSVSTLSGADTDVTSENVLLFSHTGGTGDSFFIINDLPTLPERYIVLAHIGPRGGTSYGQNTISNIVLAFQDSTHHMRVSPSSGNAEIRMFTGNGDVASSTVSSFSTATSVSPNFNDDAGAVYRCLCMLGEPDTGVDPQMQFTVHLEIEANKLDVKASTHGWTAQGGATAPSTSWDSGWQSGGSIRRPGLWFREQGASGQGYCGLFKIYEV